LEKKKQKINGTKAVFWHHGFLHANPDAGFFLDAKLDQD
jgi:hypothetical protein